MTKVKYCGMQRSKDLEIAEELKIDYTGFIFVPESRRYVDLYKLLELRNWQIRAASSAIPVLVVMDLSIENIVQVTSETGISHVQLAGQEAPLLCRELKEVHQLTVWKSLHIPDDYNGRNREDAPVSFYDYLDVVDAFLLDTSSKGQYGGTGITFSWEVLAKIKKDQIPVPIIVAGGLHPGNVGELVSNYYPDAVDVSSGIEVDGKKDESKMREFIARVREANHET